MQGAPGVDQCGIVVATMTWARSASEERLLRESLTTLAECRLPVAVADAGSSSEFLNFLRCLPRFTVTAPATPGLVGQIAASLQLAAQSDSPWILYTEPDKQLFFEERMADFLRAAPGHTDTGVVLASRSADSFRTFPRMQRYTETVINTLCRELIGVDTDYSYGPFVLHRTLVPLAASMDPRIGWGWRHHLFRMTQ